MSGPSAPPNGAPQPPSSLKVASRSHLPLALAAGSVLRGRYRLTGTLEVGPIAILHRAEEIDTGRTVAIKVFHEVGRSDRRRVEVLRRPAPHGVARLELPSGFATVYACDLTDDERLFLVTELVEGASIAQLLRQAPPLALPRALELAIRVGEALEAALNLGFLDLRIAPRDIVVLSDGDHVKLLRSDALILQRLGLADQLATAEAPERDARYVSPEELAGLPATERSVVYRFGVLVYELLYDTPFEGTTPARRRDGRVKRPAGQHPDLFGALPASLDRLLSRMLDPDPVGRPVGVTSTLNQLWDAACRVRAETPAVPMDAASLPSTVATTTQVRQLAARRWVLVSLPILIAGGTIAVWPYVVGFHPPWAVPTPAVERPPPAPSMSGGGSPARVGDNATVPPGSTRGRVREVPPGARPPEVPAPPRAAARAEPEPKTAMVNPTPPPRAPVPLPPVRPSQPPPRDPGALIPLPPARPSQPPPRDPGALIPLPPPARPSQPSPQDPGAADPGAIIDWLLRDRPQISE